MTQYRKHLYHSFPVFALLGNIFSSWEEREFKFMNFCIVLNSFLEWTNFDLGLKCDWCHCALHGFQQHNNHFPLSGSICLGNIHFLTDSSHFKGTDIFTIQFTRNSGLQPLCNLSLIFLDVQYQQNEFLHNFKCNLLIKYF